MKPKASPYNIRPKIKRTNSDQIVNKVAKIVKVSTIINKVFLFRWPIVKKARIDPKAAPKVNEEEITP